MQPSLRASTISLALCSMFGGCRSSLQADLAASPESTRAAPTYETTNRNVQFEIPNVGDLSLKCAYTRQVTGKADRITALFEGMPVFESVELAPTAPGVYRLEVYHLIPANSYRSERTLVTGIKVNNKDYPLTEKKVVYAARDVDERILAGKVEAAVDPSSAIGAHRTLSTALAFREGVPKDLLSTVWIEVFAIDAAASTERLVGAGSVGCMSWRDGPWVPSFMAEDVSKLGSADCRVTTVRDYFKLF